MTKHAEEVVPFTTDDGRTANVIHILSESAPSKGPVLLVHGAGVRANIFQAPVETTLVDDLVDHGWDVWLENWRASIDFPPCEWTLDQAAVYDHPRAVETVIDATGADTMQAVIHCQGSTSFMMSAVAGLVPQVTTIVSNAVALHPVLPPLTRWKQRLMTPLVARLMPYLDPQWDVAQGGAPGMKERAVALWVHLTHHECHNQVCKMVSFTYGMGHPTLWSHANLNDATHDWLRGEFGHVPLSVFRQMMASDERAPGLGGGPQAFRPTTCPSPRTDARFAFLSGDRNLCFLPESQRRSYECFSDIDPITTASGPAGLQPSDVFMGRQAAPDVFPVIRQELMTPTGRTP